MDDNQLLRYSRHILLPQLDVAGQQKLLAARVLVIGLGGLGSPVAMYLATSGVGELVLADDDKVEITNLQRQIIHTEQTIGVAKTDSAARHLTTLNSGVKTRLIPQRLATDQLMREAKQATVVVDCSDNFATRKQVNLACLKNRVPLVSGAAIRMEGQITVFDFRDNNSPCYQCLYDVDSDQDLSCSESGVLAPLVGVIGAMQAVETLKIIAGFGTTLTGRLGLFDAEYNEWRYLKLSKDPKCPVCSAI